MGKMPPSSKFLFLFKTPSQPSPSIFTRISASKRFSSSIFTGSYVTNVSHHPLTELKHMMGKPGSLNCLNKYYSSNTWSPRNSKSPYPLPDQAVPTISWRTFLVPGSVLAGITGLVLFMHYNDERRAIPKGKGEKFERSAIQGPIIGGPFSLIDTEGRLVTEKNLMGNWVLFYFGYTSSPDVGPAEVQKMANAIHILESKQNIKILSIFVTIDPQRDTPSHLKAYLREFDSRIVGLTGPVAAIRQMAQEYRVFFKKVDEAGDDYLVESSHNMYLMNPNMEVARSFGVEYNALDLVEAITKEMKRSENKN